MVIVDVVTSKNETGSDRQWRHWRGYREGWEGYWAGYQGPTQVVCSGLIYIARRLLIANYLSYSTQRMVNEDLDKIAAQGPWKLGIYSDLKSSRETVQASSLFCSWEVQSPISLQKHFLKYFEMWEYFWFSQCRQQSDLLPARGRKQSASNGAHVMDSRMLMAPQNFVILVHLYSR